jgi:hypothetical protein
MVILNVLIFLSFLYPDTVKNFVLQSKRKHHSYHLAKRIMIITKEKAEKEHLSIEEKSSKAETSRLFFAQIAGLPQRG